MSLSLLQGYSSAEEEDDQQPQHPYLQNSDEDEEDDDEDEQNDKEGAIHDKSFIKLPIPSSGSGSSGLPSVLDLFSEVHLSLSLSLSLFGIILLLLSFFTVMNNESSEYY